MSKGKLARSTKQYYTVAEIESAIKDKERLYSYSESGDMDSVHLIIDAQKAMKLAKPTAVQLKTVQLNWIQGFNLRETGEILGISPQGVKFNLDLLKVKIQKVLDIWRHEEIIEEMERNGISEEYGTTED